MKNFLPESLRESLQVTPERAREIYTKTTEALDAHMNPFMVRIMKELQTGFVEWRGEGIYVITPEGEKIFDCVGAGGVFGLGFAHPALVEAVCEQAKRGGLATRAGFTPNQAELATKLLALAPKNLEYAYFANSGTEALEAAIKLARLSTGRKKLIGTHYGYHGMSTGTISLSGLSAWRDGIGPYLEGTALVHHGDIKDLALEIDDDTAAVVLEPVQWASGCKVAGPDYFRQVSELCKEKGALLILDEVQTGLGRTGYTFAAEHWGVEPDILCVGKILSGGMVPISAILYTNFVQKAEFSKSLFNNSSYGGNPLACAAGITTLNLLEDKYFQRARELGDQLARGFDALLEEYSDQLAGYHGLGLMRCLEFQTPVEGLMFGARMKTDHNIIVASMGHIPQFVRVSPPFICEDEDLEVLLAACRATLDTLRDLGVPGLMKDLEAMLAGVNKITARAVAAGEVTS